MTSRDRIIAALELKQPDRVPFFEMLINQKVRKAIEGKETSMADFVEKWDIDGIFAYPSYKNNYIDKNTFIDEWGIKRKLLTEDYPVPIEGPIKKKSDLKRYELPDPNDKYRYSELIQTVRRFKGKKAIIFKINDVLSVPRYLRGTENFFMDIADDPNFTKQLVDLSVQYNIQLAKNAANLGADIVLSSDDYCDNSGPFISPDSFKKYFYPGFKEVVKSAKDFGLYFIKHTDGNILPIMDLIIDAGCHGFDTVDIAAGMSLSHFKKNFGNKICLFGNVDVGRILQDGTTEEVVNDVLRSLKEGAENGGYIIKSSSDIHSEVKPENFIKMMETIKKFSDYPIHLPENL